MTAPEAPLGFSVATSVLPRFVPGPVTPAELSPNERDRPSSPSSKLWSMPAAPPDYLQPSEVARVDGRLDEG